ncbi:hybrid sensor histidine kinase/response regulator transcription factor [Chryseolinea lacunae]|uniref:histidine kinase n=1 Tax=Chryseolinea lacunae TaxID=2801331 RepID=A0ABS1KKD1_9BACT|nr:two-component regulator propeller domain-containing protein [Chryseolinea lacunae]MBL0739805.1 response regulator [Chryseolinea lacunae]
MRLIAGLFLLMTLSAAGQQEPESRVKRYGIKDGLSQGVVNSITQDDQGLMWFATEDGLNRFDGYSFKIFKHDSDNSKSLADNFVQNIFKDSEGSFWVSSRKGLHHFDRLREQFTLYQHHPTKGGSSSPQNDVSFITEGSAHNLWIAWYAAGFASFNKTTGVFTPYNQMTLPGLSSTQTLALHEDKYGLLWVGTQDGGLEVFKVSNGVVVKRQETLSDNKALPSLNVRCFAEDLSGNLWIGTADGLVLYKRQENRFYTFNVKSSGIAGGNIFSLLADRHENLWIGVQGGGLFVLDLRQLTSRAPEDVIIRHIENLVDYDISKRTVQSLYEDKDDNLWMGTFGDGIYMKSSVKERFVKIQTKQYFKTASSFVQYCGMTYDPNGYLWLGTEANGIYKSKLNGETVRHYTADGAKGSLTDNSVLSALRDHENTFWFGTYSKGIFRYDEKRDAFVNYPFVGSPSQTGGRDVRVIFEDSKKNIWVGTNRGGLCLLDKATQTYRNPPGINSSLQYGDIRAITEDSSGKLWLGLYGDGLHQFDPETKVSKRLFHPSEEEDELHSNVVFALSMDRQNNLWIGTGGGGIHSYDTRTKTIKRYDNKNGLANNTIYSILIDNADNLWMGTNKGISKFEKDKQQFTNYDVNDGLQEGQYNTGSAVYNDIAGYMCFGGTMGLNIFYPEKVMKDLKEPEVMISGLQLFNKPVEVNAKNENDFVLDQVISQTQHITLKHDQSVFTFDFVGLNYSYPEKNKYAYMLEGLDHEWNYVGNQRSATYRYLGPGEYTFKVKASNQDNTWSDAYASVDVTILPPFWRTPWAYLLYVLVLGGMCGTVLLVRRKQATLRKRLKIEKAQRKRERQRVREKLSFFTEVSHEFRTPLTLMIGPLEEMVMREGNTSTGRKLKMVYRNAHKLLNLINKLLDYRKIESGNVVLKVSEENVVTFVEEVYITFKELALRKNIDFQFISEVPSIKVWFDTEKLEMAVTNILSNAFKYIGKGNAVSIAVQPHEDRVVIRVSDNGIGIPRKQLHNIFNWFYKGDDSGPMSSGIGLALAKKLVHLHHGEILVDSVEGKGSVFSISLLLGKDHFKPEDLCAPKDSEKFLFAPHEDHAPLPTLVLAESEEDNAAKKGLQSVLIAEDDEDIRAFLKEYFEKRYRILEADNGKDALALALEYHPDLIISDIMMPEMDGIELTHELKANLRTSHIPVILLTARTSHTHHKEGIEGGADAYITKPFSPEMLSLTIQNLLQLRENLKRFYRNLFTQATPVAESPKDVNGVDEKFLHSIYDTLKANLDNPAFNVNELCEALSMSRTLVYKKVKMLTGLTPVEYLRSLRMQEAARLLKSHQYKVFEVVYMVGFSDLKYFRQSFVKEFGYPPSEYSKNTEGAE